MLFIGDASKPRSLQVLRLVRVGIWLLELGIRSLLWLTFTCQSLSQDCDTLRACLLEHPTRSQWNNQKRPRPTAQKQNRNTESSLAFPKVCSIQNYPPTIASRITLTNPIPDAQVTKRPLLRPAIPSPYTSSTTQKVVYVSARTPFMSAIKRVEKLLQLADKRDVQAATTLAKKNSNNKRKRRREDDGGEDEIGAIARFAEEGREKKKRVGGVGGEEVLIKGTGKAVAKVMEMGCWFLQRDGFEVRVRTGSVGAVDDVEVPEKDEEEEAGEKMDLDQAEPGADAEGDGKKEEQSKEVEAVSGARVRYLSVLEVAVSIR